MFIFRSKILLRSSPLVSSFIFLLVAFSKSYNFVNFPLISYIKVWFSPNFYMTGSRNLERDSYIYSLETKLSWVLSMPKVVITLYSKVKSFILTSSSRECKRISLLLLQSLSRFTYPSTWQSLCGSKPPPSAPPIDDMTLFIESKSCSIFLSFSLIECSFSWCSEVVLVTLSSSYLGSSRFYSLSILINISLNLTSLSLLSS